MKKLCTICYKKEGKKIDNLYCEKCFEELISELNTINPRLEKQQSKKEIKYKTIEEEYFNKNK
jgi:hypothetical protein